MAGTLLTPRVRDTIREQALARIKSDATDTYGVTVSGEPPDQLWLEQDALAILLSAAELRAAGAPDAILPDRAVGESLRHHGSVLDLVCDASSGQTLEQFRAAVLERRRLILGAATAPDWVAWAKQVTGVSEAYFYPRLAGGTTSGLTVGRGTLLVMGPASGTSITDTRVLGAGIINNVVAYIEGLADADGNVVSGTQLRPVTTEIEAGGGCVSVETCSVLSQAVTINVRCDSLHQAPWTPFAGLAITASTTTTAQVAGDSSALALAPMSLTVGPANARGGLVKAAPVSASYNGGTNRTTFTFTPALPAAPFGVIYPAPPNWQQIRDAVFAVFDALGPGITADDLRWPHQSAHGPHILRVAQLARAVMDVTGVINALVTAGPGDVTPAAKQIVELGQLLIEPNL